MRNDKGTLLCSRHVRLGRVLDDEEIVGVGQGGQRRDQDALLAVDVAEAAYQWYGDRPAQKVFGQQPGGRARGSVECMLEERQRWRDQRQQAVSEASERQHRERDSVMRAL